MDLVTRMYAIGWLMFSLIACLVRTAPIEQQQMSTIVSINNSELPVSDITTSATFVATVTDTIGDTSTSKNGSETISASLPVTDGNGTFVAESNKVDSSVNSTAPPSAEQEATTDQETKQETESNLLANTTDTSNVTDSSVAPIESTSSENNISTDVTSSASSEQSDDLIFTSTEPDDDDDFDDADDDDDDEDLSDTEYSLPIDPKSDIDFI